MHACESVVYLSWNKIRVIFGRRDWNKQNTELREIEWTILPHGHRFCWWRPWLSETLGGTSSRSLCSVYSGLSFLSAVCFSAKSLQKQNTLILDTCLRRFEGYHRDRVERTTRLITVAIRVCAHTEVVALHVVWQTHAQHLTCTWCNKARFHM